MRCYAFFWDRREGCYVEAEKKEVKRNHMG